MALGGGTFTNYNKVLPGTYVNFISLASASGEVSDRGVAAIADSFSWGPEGEIFTLTADEFVKNSVKYFGCSYMSDEVLSVREVFLNASKLHVFRLGKSVKAKNTLGEAKYGGVCGNMIKIKVAKNIDRPELFDVTTYFSNVAKDVQTVASAEKLQDNDFVVFKKTGQLAVNAGEVMAGGSDATVRGEDYQAFLDAAENVSFNTLGVASTDSSVNALVAAFTKRMRDERGVKFQSVLYNYAADDMSVINLVTSASGKDAAALVWFVTGASAGCPVNKSLLNKKYNGSCTITKPYTQSELEEAIEAGKFVFHKTDDEYRVLADINSLVSTNFECGEVFKENQTVRVIDQIAIDDANIFKTKYLGVVPNDEAGRLSLWNDITEHRKTLEKMRAIENFNEDDVVVTRGEKKTAVVITEKICPVNSMAQLYITTTVE